VSRFPFTVTVTDMPFFRDRRNSGSTLTAAVTETAARYAGQRPELDEISQRAISAAVADTVADLPDDGSLPSASRPEPDPGKETANADDELWLALCVAPDEGTDVGELVRLTGMSRPTLYRRLANHAKADRAIQVSCGRWRAQMTQEPPRD
jgi:hypothetical protein